MSRMRQALHGLIEFLLARTRRGSEEYPKLFCLAGDHIGDHIFIHGLYERDLLEGLFDDVLKPLKDRFSETTCLDVGANIGNHTLFLSGRFREVLSFEPNRLFAAAVRLNTQFNGVENVKIHETGLSDENQTLIYAMRKDSLGESHFIENGDADSGIPLEVRRGDDVVGANGPDISLIKIDVEGHEYKAIKGLSETIKRCAPIVLFESIAERDGDKIEPTIGLLRELGLRHIYSYEAPHNPYSNKIMKAGYRLIAGYQRRLAPIEANESSTNCLLLIASPNPL
ncbi:FkbM family methyltransferase [Hyphococcus sp.]|uniref:FkbM family methyltransferase n=1 Tax=Hyphococcus sp. TaxID=2038636 RepID=UPI0035C76866